MKTGEKGRGAGFVRRIYLARLLGYAMGALPLMLLLHAQRAPGWLVATVLAVCFVWPHVAYLRVRGAPDRLARERANMLGDSACGGWLAASIHFEPIGTLIVLLMFALDNMAVGGWRLFSAGLAASAATLGLGAAIGGTTIWIDHDPMIALAWVPVAVVYPLVLAKVTHDVSVKLIERSRRLRELNERDSLTGLANRVSVVKALAAILATADSAKERISVLFIDLDSFKTVNDALGHNIGDQLLVAIAERLSACALAGDVVARYGGDEFVVVARGVDGEFRRDLPDAVLSAFAQPLCIGGHELVIGASIGISKFPADGHDAATLIRAADIAMYGAKNRGRNCFEYYRAKMRIAADARLTLSSRLRKAIEAGGLRLYYQPQVDMRTGQVHGVEALVRWRDEVYGDIRPADFIEVAEASGLVSPLGEWVLAEACRQAVEWQRMGIQPMRMSVNLSPLQLQRASIVASFERILSESGMDPALVELEVTETALMRQPDAAVRRLHEFRRAGISVAIDDFGMGYSSLGQLRTLPLDRIKIDRGFVREIGAGDSGAIATAIVTLAKALGLAVIAEGVETIEQRNFLLGIGCTDAQGYLYSRALDAQSATRLLRENGPLPRHPRTKNGRAGRLTA